MKLIRRFVDNPVAANMLMLLMLLGGAYMAWRIPRELFPEFAEDRIRITVTYPGASPSEVEDGVILPIEEELEGLEGIEETLGVSREGVGVVTLEVATDADVRTVLDKVKSKVDQVDLPPEIEDYEVVELTRRSHVVHIAVAGEAPERTLKEIAEDIREEIQDLPEVSQVVVGGVRDYEILVEVTEQALRRHELTLAAVARAISEGSFDLPAGSVKTTEGELTLRVTGKLYHAADYEKLVVLSRPDGTVVRLGEVATVREGFADVDIGGQFNGKPAVMVSVFKTPEEDTVAIARAVREYIRRKQAQVPAGIEVAIWADTSKLIQDRLDLLVRNGVQGLVLVVAVLWLFLGWRLSFWVALGIPVSLLGTILMLHVGGMSLNMISMFALIMALGLIVDDAIVVGENVFALVEKGMPPSDAAVAGTRGVLLPVLAAVTTTWVAFVPLLFLPGLIGRFMAILPTTVILALALSLLECVVILPPHLAYSLRARQRAAAGAPAWPARARARIDAAIRTVIDVHFARLYRAVARYRYVTVAVLAGVLAVVGAAWATGRIPATFFPRMESDTLVARLRLPTGTPLARTEQYARQIAQAALAMNAPDAPGGGKPVVQHVYALLGAEAEGADGDVPEGGSHVAEVIVELIPAEKRAVRSEDAVTQWRENTGPIPEALTLTFGAYRHGPGGAPLEIRLLGDSTDALKPAAELLKTELAGFHGVTDIEDDALPGNMEMRVRLKDEGHSLGINLATLAAQLRNAFYGYETLKLQRGRDEVKVRVSYPASRRRSLGQVEDMRIRTAAGDEVPFLQVADVRLQRGYTTLRRVGRDSVITVSADVDESVANAEEVLEELSGRGFFDGLAAAFPGMKISLQGQRKQWSESLGSLKVFYPVALLAIFTILAGMFKSYLQPIIVMVAIPFGLVGALIGLRLMGYNISIMSLLGMVALTGIVVNDSLVLIDYLNGRVRDGMKIHAAAEAAALRRFRPIVLTTATTVAGMMPILLERSFQAQFLKPMVAAVVFGLSLATVLTLLVVPCLYLIGNDAARALRWIRTGRWPSPEEASARARRTAQGERPREEPAGAGADDRPVTA